MAQPTKSKPKRSASPKGAGLGAMIPPDLAGGLGGSPGAPTDLGPPTAAAPMGAPQSGPVGPTPMGAKPFKPSDLVKKGQSKSK